MLLKIYFKLPLKAISSISHFSTIIQAESFALTKQAFTSLLQSHSSNPNPLKQIHALILTSGLSVKNGLLTQLLTYFTVLGDMHYARQLFDEMHKPRPYIWNTLIIGYVKNSFPSEAASVYSLMHTCDIRPDSFTFPFVLKACTELDYTLLGLAVHVHVLKYGLDYITMVKTELMVMYAKFSDLHSSNYLFETMVEKDLVAWNALITVYAQNGNAVNALRLFHQMDASGTRPDSVTVVGALSACSHLGCLETGEFIYEFAREEGMCSNIIVNNAMLDVHMKCGSIDKALNLFDTMPRKNVVSYSTMIGGYAMNGESEKALALFSKMKEKAVQPNYVTFLAVLSACSHAGLVREGQHYFNYISQSNDKNLKPRKEHYACMVDLLGRSGHLKEAYSFIQTMPFKPDPGVWGALLGACAIHQNIELGQDVADSLFALAPDIGSYHILLSNMYAAAGRWCNVEKVRAKMRKKGVNKVVAYSSVEFNGQIHILRGGEKMHPQAKIIYEKLDKLINDVKVIGYRPMIGSVLHDVDIEEKEASLSTHSEKLAIVFALINVRTELPIRVIKNLRTCDDCHNFCKFVSRITNREIVMRDKSRFHHFKDGFCSCKDFW